MTADYLTVGGGMLQRCTFTEAPTCCSLYKIRTHAADWAGAMLPSTLQGEISAYPPVAWIFSADCSHQILSLVVRITTDAHLDSCISRLAGQSVALSEKPRLVMCSHCI